MKDIKKINVETGRIFTLKHNNYIFILDGVKTGSFELDYKDEDKGYKAITDSSKLAYTFNCKYGLIFKIVTPTDILKSELKELDGDNWDDCMQYLSSYLYYAILPQLKVDDPNFIKELNVRLSKYIDKFSIKSFKEVSIIVSCGEALHDIGLEPSKGFWSSLFS